MPKVTVEISADDLQWFQRWADYNRDDVSDLLSELLVSRRRARRGSITLDVPATEQELQRWTAEADRRGFYVDEWVRRMANFVSTTHVTEGHTFTRHGDGTALWVGMCAWCNAELPERCSWRRVFCSDVCRVRSWRASRRERETEESEEGTGAS